MLFRSQSRGFQAKPRPAHHYAEYTTACFDGNPPPIFPWTGLAAEDDDEEGSDVTSLILDSFIFRVFPAKFLRWFSSIVEFIPRSRVYSLVTFFLPLTKRGPWLLSLSFFHGHLLRCVHFFFHQAVSPTSSKCAPCHPPHPSPKSLM